MKRSIVFCTAVLFLSLLCAASAFADVPGRYYEYKSTAMFEPIFPFLANRPATTPQQADFKLWLPDGMQRLKGLIVVSRHGSGDSLSQREDLRELAARLDAGIVSFIGLAVQSGVVPGLLDGALVELGKQSGHPELINAPMLVFGMSNGCAFSCGQACMTPERVIGWIAYHPGGGKLFTRFFDKKTVDAAAAYHPDNAWVRKDPAPLYSIPGLVMLGEIDPFAGLGKGTPENPDYNCLWEFEEMRRRYQPLAHLIVEGGVSHGHIEGRTWTIVLQFMEEAFRLRVPADADPRRGPVKLNVLKAADGCLGRNWDLKTGSWQDLPIMAIKDYSGDIGKTSWLPSKSYALKWQEYSKNGIYLGPGAPTVAELKARPAGGGWWDIRLRAEGRIAPRQAAVSWSSSDGPPAGRIWAVRPLKRDGVFWTGRIRPVPGGGPLSIYGSLKDASGNTVMSAVRTLPATGEEAVGTGCLNSAEVGIVRAVRPPGQDEAAWATAPVLGPIAARAAAVGEYSSYLQAMWDEENLYLLLRSDDASPWKEAAGARWNSDCIQWRLRTDARAGEVKAVAWEISDLMLDVYATGGQEGIGLWGNRTIWGVSRDIKDFSAVESSIVRRSGGGFTLYTTIPWRFADPNFKAAVGRKLRLGFIQTWNDLLNQEFLHVLSFNNAHNKGPADWGGAVLLGATSR